MGRRPTDHAGLGGKTEGKTRAGGRQTGQTGGRQACLASVLPPTLLPTGTDRSQLANQRRVCVGVTGVGWVSCLPHGVFVEGDNGATASHLDDAFRRDLTLLCQTVYINPPPVAFTTLSSVRSSLLHCLCSFAASVLARSLHSHGLYTLAVLLQKTSPFSYLLLPSAATASPLLPPLLLCCHHFSSAAITSLLLPSLPFILASPQEVESVVLPPSFESGYWQYVFAHDELLHILRHLCTKDVRGKLFSQQNCLWNFAEKKCQTEYHICRDWIHGSCKEPAPVHPGVFDTTVVHVPMWCLPVLRGESCTWHSICPKGHVFLGIIRQRIAHTRGPR
ncbi:hypothetical protein DM02DRAFT_724944 [Periconia macrospinosa]|uniref:Uncharacterized protein n=1 Tax=Periconia macrospinosa TaxID=97972 RepID=A0A2V1E5X2_9PLEO|nr:hypothetical protein DM02DRAFT_724944 [Periconia macrospinosa]